MSSWTEQRQEIAGWYDQLLSNVGDLVLPACHPNATHVYHVYVVRTQQRDKLQQHLQQQGIGTLIHYPLPPHLQNAYAYLGYQPGDFSIAEEIAGSCLSLPLYPGLKYEQVEQVARIMQQFF